MPRPILPLVLLGLCLSIAGCGGGGLEADLMRAAKRDRPGTEAPPPPPAAEPPPKAGETKADARAVAKGPIAGPLATAAGPSEPATSNERPEGPLTEVERRARSIANLEKIGRALAAYAEKWGQLPPGGIPRDGELLLSWRVVILPELGYPDLYRRFKTNEPWDSPHNKLLLDYIPPEYQSPERFDAKTNYLGVAGHGLAIATGALESIKSGVRLDAMKDGADNTLAVIEVDDKYAQEWTRPTDHVPQLELPADKLGGLRGEGAFGVLVSGRVVLLPREMPVSRLAALFTVAGGEPVGSSSDFLNAPTAEPPPPTLATVADDPAAANQPALSGETQSAAVENGAHAGPLGFPGSAPYVADGAKDPLPDAPSLVRARALLQELYASDYARARTRQQRQQFVQKLLADVPNVEDNPADYHELVRIARDMAVALGDVKLALIACELLEQRFQVDALAQRLSVFQGLDERAREIESVEPVLQAIEAVLRDAFDADRFDVALPLVEVALHFTRMRGNKAEIARLQQQAEALAAAQSLYIAAQRAWHTLKENPSDAAANEAVGRYLCFVKVRWESGLPFLARSADIQLRGIASLELATDRSLGDTLSLADQYWDMAGKLKQPQRRGLHLRAVHCYAAVAPSMPPSLERVRVQRRLDEATELYGREETDRILTPLSDRRAAQARRK